VAAIAAFIAGTLATSAAATETPYAGVLADPTGQMVVSVSATGFAWRDGIRPGQRITASTPADSPGGWRLETEDAAGQYLSLEGPIDSALVVGRRERPAVIVLSSFGISQDVAAAVRFGAQGFCLKTAPPDKLISAIRRVAAGGCAFTAEQLREGRSGFVALSHREHDVLRLILESRSNDEVSSALHISPKTVEAHRSRLYERFRAMSRTELALRAEREGWLDVGGDS
jgi:DNA-binding CsgD family transcriptional regulator